MTEECMNKRPGNKVTLPLAQQVGRGLPISQKVDKELG